jgi:TRAP transporter 4TM/12TM fusion protein
VTLNKPLRFVGRLVTLAAGLITALLPVAWSLDPFRLLSGAFVVDQFLAIELTIAMSLTFFVASAAGVVRRYVRIGLGCSAIVLGLLLALYFGSDQAFFVQPTPALLTGAAILAFLCGAAIWLGSGWRMALLMIGVLALGFVAQYFGPPFNAVPVRLDRYLTYMTFGGDGFLGRALETIASTVTIYILFGAAFVCSGGAAAIDAVARLLAGRGKGIAIKATVISSGVFGMVSGSATSNVLTSGTYSINSMRRFGVPAGLAGGIEAGSSTIGQVIPPVMGAAAFLMADVTGIPYGEIALAAAIPGLICIVVMVQQGEALARRYETEAVVGALDDERAALSPRLLWHLLPLATILGVMTLGDRATELAGILGTVAALVVGLFLVGPKQLLINLRQQWPSTVSTIAQLVVAASALGIFVAVLALSGLDVSLTLLIRHLGEQSLVLSLLLTALAALLLGAGMPTSGVYIVAGSLLAPGLVALGVPPIAAHLFVLYYGMLSMITPPVAFAALAASAISGASFTETANAAVSYGWIMFVVPFLFALQPALVLVGSPGEVATSLLVATLALICLGTAFGGKTALRRRVAVAPAIFAVTLLLVLPSEPHWWQWAGVGLLAAATLAVAARRDMRPWTHT